MRRIFSSLLMLACIATQSASAAEPKVVDNPARGLWDGNPPKTATLVEDFSVGGPDAVFRQIADAAVDSKGRILVLDAGDPRVTICHPDSAAVLVFGDGPGEFRRPQAIAVDEKDRIYVADMEGRVAMYSPGGDFLGEFRQVIRDEDVSGIRFTQDGMYIADFDRTSKKVVHWYDTSHHYRSSFSDSWSVVHEPPPCRGADRFAQGGAIDVDDDGFVYYTQYTPYEIRKFSPDGTLVLTIHRENDYQPPRIDCADDGPAFYSYAGSCRILVASNGRIMNVVQLVTDDYKTAGCLVDMFDADGHLLTTIQVGPWTRIHCLDRQDRIIATEDRKIASEWRKTLVRYQVALN